MPEYPRTRRGDVVETLHGHEIADPFRWLEDPDDPEVVDWVARQRAFTESALADLPSRAWFQATMRSVVRRPRAGVPSEHAGRFLVRRNDGTQQQDVLYVADSLEDLLAGGRILLDPNTWSADGTTSLAEFTVSRDGRLLAYCVSEAGSDWQRIRVIDIDSGDRVVVVGDDPQADLLTKFCVPHWLPDHASLLYNAAPGDARTEGTATAALGGMPLAIHRLGDPLGADHTVWHADDERLLAWAEPSHDGRWLFIAVARGTENVNTVLMARLDTTDGRTTAGQVMSVIGEPTAGWQFVRTVGDDVLLQTDADAPLGRVVRLDLAAIERGEPTRLTEVVPESQATLESVRAVGERLLCSRLDDAQPRLTLHDLDGRQVCVLATDGGAVVEINGDVKAGDAFVGMSSVTTPTHSFRVDVATGEVEPLRLVAESSAVAPEVRVERHQASSQDGTDVPYFLISRADLTVDTPRPTLLYGYGGFRIPVLADYRPGWTAWLAAGGVLAIANLRGGGEFGTAWYEGGRRASKQNVFDDLIGVAEALIRAHVTTSDQLAVHGRSNGGLLVGAVMTQRPDLFACALPTVGVLDLLRFHLFTIGAAWISDYGDPDDASEFEVARAYSPLHNIRPGTSYPPTLVCTGDHDDRVVPLHSHKFTAALQHAQAADAPVLTRIETATGHGAGKPIDLVADEWADLLAFAAHHTGLATP